MFMQTFDGKIFLSEMWISEIQYKMHLAKIVQSLIFLF